MMAIFLGPFMGTGVKFNCSQNRRIVLPLDMVFDQMDSCFDKHSFRRSSEN